ncbi:MAG: hypothetical protein GY786_03555, partial [Proteobacteria bacterium]|nr:hypothetical protein [Pseudomonadota bacterium]
VKIEITDKYKETVDLLNREKSWFPSSEMINASFTKTIDYPENIIYKDNPPKEQTPEVKKKRAPVDKKKHFF